MSQLLADLVRQIGLQPGQTIRENVNGYIAELKLVKEDEVTPTLAEQVMLQPWAEFPFNPIATVTARLGPPQFPKPITIDETDLAPE